MRLADPANNDAKMKLAEIYEIMNEPRRALELVYEGKSPRSMYLTRLDVQLFFLVIDSRKKRPREAAFAASAGPSIGTASTSLFQEDRMTSKTKTPSGTAARPQNRLTHAQLRELEAEKEREALRGWARVQDLWSEMLTSMHGEEPTQEEREWLLEAEKLVETFRETRNLFLTSRVSRFVVDWT